MLTFAILLPFAAAVALALIPAVPAALARFGAIATAAVSLLLLIAVWAGYGGGGFGAVEEVPWIPTLGIAWRVGVDGMSLALLLMSGVVFVAAIAWPMEIERARAYYAWLLFLMGASLGLFAALDLIIFYVFFDLSLVGMYFLIGRWGHGDAEHAALKFFIYTLAGSLLILIGIIVLALAGPELTFDMRPLIETPALEGAGVVPALVLLAFVVGFGIKTPVFPLHTWLPPAHVDAPGPASAILAGVLLKMGTYGLVRIPLQMMPDTFARWALPIAVVGVISILWGSIVAFAQGNLKRRIAYTSVNHMGYTVLGIAVAGSALGSEAARALALTGAVVEMVAHGLITGSLFLIAGAFWQKGAGLRAGTFRRSCRRRAPADRSGGAGVIRLAGAARACRVRGRAARLPRHLRGLAVAGGGRPPRHPYHSGAVPASAATGVLRRAARRALGVRGPDRERGADPRGAAGARGADRRLAHLAAVSDRRGKPHPRHRGLRCP